MRITVINFRSIIKYIFFFVITVLIIVISLKLIKIGNIAEKNTKSISLAGCLKYEIPIINVLEENVQEIPKIKFGLRILSMQIGAFDNIKENDKDDKLIERVPIYEEIKSNTEEDTSTETGDLEGKETKVIDENNIKETYTNKYKNIKINNQTSYDISEVLENSSYTFTNAKKAIIYHTHTCESYTPTENYNYSMTDSYRTTNLNFTVVGVGDELSKELQKYGMEVIHNKAYHDYPSYNGSYGRSLSTLESLLSNNSDTEMVIDLHRDAVGSMSKYAPCVQIGDEVCAQIMFVVGTDGSGLEHNNWRKNLEYAIKVQSIADELYPGLFRPIILRSARYNQHLTTASTIIEVGATGNTMEQCLASMKYLANVLYKSTQ